MPVIKGTWDPKSSDSGLLNVMAYYLVIQTFCLRINKLFGNIVMQTGSFLKNIVFIGTGSYSCTSKKRWKATSIFATL